MANLSQSHFLQSLGWATLNSLWQMALLWCLYLTATSLLSVSAHKKYQFSVAAVGVGFAWFLVSFFSYYQSSPVSTMAFFNQTIRENNALLSACLLSASVTYLALLVFPSYKLYRNWLFVQRIKKEGLHKADFNHRVFVQKIASHLGISARVAVYVSDLVRSPLTVGYLKPVVLLPVAALNNLSTQQVEAILLHELSHIRRYDYLMNLMLSLVHTLLYFNPFMRQFMKVIEEERENCCDQLVLQFGYDKVGYASALLTLEKLSVQQQALALGATGKNYLLTRIEKIVGLEKKKSFKRNQFAGMLAAFFCILLFNSALIIRESKKQSADYAAFNTMPGLFGVDNNTDRAAPSFAEKPSVASSHQNDVIEIAQPDSDAVTNEDGAYGHPFEHPQDVSGFINVAQDDVDAVLSPEEKATIHTTVENTKRVVNGLQWKEIEKTIGDAMSEKEKLMAKQEYLKAMEKEVDWKRVEQNIKAQYQQMNLARVNAKLDNALALIQLDSLEKNYTKILSQLDKSNAEAAAAPSGITILPIPDQSVEEVKRSTEALRDQVKTLRAIQSPKKVVRL